MSAPPLSLVDLPSRNPVALLRQLADELEAGATPPTRMVVILQRDNGVAGDDPLEVRAAGTVDLFSIAGLCFAAATWLAAPRIEPA